MGELSARSKAISFKTRMTLVFIESSFSTKRPILNIAYSTVKVREGKNGDRFLGGVSKGSRLDLQTCTARNAGL